MGLYLTCDTTCNENNDGGRWAFSVFLLLQVQLRTYNGTCFGFMYCVTSVLDMSKYNYSSTKSTDSHAGVPNSEFGSFSGRSGHFRRFLILVVARSILWLSEVF